MQEVLLDGATIIERVTSFFGAEEWLPTLEIVPDFMELKVDEEIICAIYVLRKEAQYWWDAMKARRNIR